MHVLKMKGYKKKFYANTNIKRTGVTILRTEKIDFNSNTIIRNKGSSRGGAVVNESD